jgi:hypothetical protein
MFIGYLKVNIFIPYSRSLKTRRQVLSRIKQRAKNNFNVSIAEKPSDKWQRCELSFVCVNYTRKCVDAVIERIESFIKFNSDIHILEIKREIL